jgi:hypothetical protein
VLFEVDEELAEEGALSTDRRIIGSGQCRVEPWNVKEKKKDKAIEQVVVKTVAGFLNGRGGTLLIGVTDDRRPVGGSSVMCPRAGVGQSDEIADGPPLVSFPALLRQVDAERRATRHAVAARTGDPSLTAADVWWLAQCRPAAGDPRAAVTAVAPEPDLDAAIRVAQVLDVAGRQTRASCRGQNTSNTG